MSKENHGASGSMETGSPNAAASSATIDIVIPVYNEEHALTPCIERLSNALAVDIPFHTRITIADNASTDRTWEVAGDLVRRYPTVRRIHLAEKGRGRALKKVWLQSECDVVAYMDVDLSTDLHGLLPLLAPLVSDHSDIAIGTRLDRSSNVVRGPKREFISRSYNAILRAAGGAHFSDAQCGFKAMRSDAARAILPYVEDNNWFFDTEMLLLAEKAGYRIHEVPVDWTDDPDSRVNVMETALQDLRGLWRVNKDLFTGRLDVEAFRRERRSSQPPGLAASKGEPAKRSLWTHVWRFALVGVVCTVAYAALYLVFAAMMPGQMANLLALILTTLLNTAANRAFTFGISGNRNLGKDHISGFAIFGLCWALTATSLALLHVLDPHASSLVELIVLTVANAVATLVRFVALRAWFLSRRRNSAETNRKPSRGFDLIVGEGWNTETTPGAQVTGVAQETQAAQETVVTQEIPAIKPCAIQEAEAANLSTTTPGAQTKPATDEKEASQ